MTSQYTCEECGETFVSDSEEELIQAVHSHAHSEHGEHLGSEEIKEGIEEA